MADVPLLKSPVALTELAGADTATAGQVPTADGVGGVAWGTPAGGAAIGEWTTYTPAWGASTPPSIGNGHVRGLYRMLDDDFMELQIELLIGSTTTFGSGTWTFTLPSGYQSPPEGASGLVQHLPAYMRDASPVAYYMGFARLNGFDATTLSAVMQETTGASTVDPTNPITWASGDRLNITGSIKVAATP